MIIGKEIEVSPPPFNKEVAWRHGLHFREGEERLAGARWDRTLLNVQTNFIKNWFEDAITHAIRIGKAWEAGGGAFELNYARTIYRSKILHMWVPAYFVIRDDPRHPLLPNIYDIGAPIYLHAIQVSDHLSRLTGYCYTPHLLGLFDTLLSDARTLWPVVPAYIAATCNAVRPAQDAVAEAGGTGGEYSHQRMLAGSADVADESQARPVPVQAEPSYEDSKVGLLESARDPTLPTIPLRRRRGGPLGHTYAERKEIILDWAKEQHKEKQDIFCSRHKISRESLQRWMREMPEVVDEAFSNSARTPKAS